MTPSATSRSGCAVVDGVVVATCTAVAVVVALAVVVAGQADASGGIGSAGEPGDHGRFIAVGDSILLGARSQLDSRLRFLGWPAVLDLEVSRSTSAGAAALASHRPGPADVVVVSLGANDSGNADLFRTRAEGVADVASSAASVYWLTIAEVRPYYPATNDIVRELAGRYPNMVVVDWAAVAGADPSLTARDGLHLTPGGSVAMADEIFRAIIGGMLGADRTESVAVGSTSGDDRPATSTAPPRQDDPDDTRTPQDTRAADDTRTREDTRAADDTRTPQDTRAADDTRTREDTRAPDDTRTPQDTSTVAPEPSPGSTEATLGTGPTNTMDDRHSGRSPLVAVAVVVLVAVPVAALGSWVSRSWVTRRRRPRADQGRADQGRVDPGRVDPGNRHTEQNNEHQKT